jgi:hypothetical protein
MDSQIKTFKYEINDEEAEDLISKIGAKFAIGAQRPATQINLNEEGFIGINVDLDEDSESHYTPGNSIYQISLHRQEANNGEENDDFL